MLIQNDRICTSAGRPDCAPSACNWPLGGSAGVVRERPAAGMAVRRGAGPPFPLRGIIGSLVAASRTPCGHRCAAGLRPVLDPAARSHGVAAVREREQRGSWGGWQAREWLARRAGAPGVSRPPWMQSGSPVALPGSWPRRLWRAGRLPAGSRPSFEPRHGEAPARWHVVRKPSPARGRQRI